MSKGRAAGHAKATPATVVLNRNGVDFQLHSYDVAGTATGYGEAVADALGVDHDRIFKTLVVEVDGNLTVAVIPVSAQLDFRALAAAAGGKRAGLADQAAAERATGYVRGGISPFGQRRKLPTVVDASVRALPTMLVSAGRRGLQVELTPTDLIAVTRARVAGISRT